ncbi:MAG: YdcF family protein [Thermocaproicibacter melissae]|jgi:uncharacterized SAM-binding protein YcdF (DUF218 family)|uniref:YdcF family protein n=1 Tax=Thermocaproicibacter melissae TaxID=2966552 RepID=UPI0024B1D162|nr:YdcF family protein [Thermocaproicibacter melissae]WBY64199.1 YdcF family protein [Thermocaproicibacter melissae]
MNRKFSPWQIILSLAAAAGAMWFLIPYVLCRILNIGNGCGLAVCFVLIVLALFWKNFKEAAKHSRGVKIVLRTVVALLCAGAAWTAAMTACMLSVSFQTPPPDAPVIVLGSMVRGDVPSADLQSRIDTASAYLKEHPQAKCIASGGQGKYESVTEASAIKNALVADGIEPSRILTEETSTNTRMNFEYSLKLAKDNGLGTTFAVVTDDYHVFRACYTAKKVGIQAYAVPAETPWYILSSCWSREVLALTKYLLLG